MDKVKIKDDTRQFVNVAWLRNGDFEVTGEALILVCLLHSTGAGRKSKDMEDLQRLMRDQNLDSKARR
jgi:hypothetical protein